MKNPFYLLTLFLFFLLTLFTSCHKEFPTFTVTFNANGGTGTMSSQTFTENVAQALTTNTFTHATLQFNGWATSATGAVVYTNGQSITISSNLSLFAKWKSTEPITGQPCPTSPTVTDCQGNVYNTVLIGTQCWTRENLKATKYDTNSERPNVLLSANYDWGYGPYFQISILSHTDAGNLYNWAAAVALENWSSQSIEFSTKRQGICPNGWHVPTEDEWTTLGTYLGGDEIAGGKMKTTGTIYWNSPNIGATNSSGFSAVPAGYADVGAMPGVGFDANFWSATASDDQYACGGNLRDNTDYFFRYNYGHKSVGKSVRCIKD